MQPNSSSSSNSENRPNIPFTIIADTSCFIVLSKINRLNLLQQLFGNVITTLEVAHEYGEALPSWVSLLQVNNINLQKSLAIQVDNGEASAIALALEHQNSLLILDDFKARKIAARFEIDVTGTIGIIIQAKREGIVSAMKPILEQIQATNFRLSDDLIAHALKLSGE